MLLSSLMMLVSIFLLERFANRNTSNVRMLVGEMSFNFHVEDEGDEVRLMSASGRD